MRGYYKDPEKTEKLCVSLAVLDGFSLRLRQDRGRRFHDLLGRGSMCINTAGEKVFPEEVEEALKATPLCGIVCWEFLTKNLGESVALASCTNEEFSESELIDHCRTR